MDMKIGIGEAKEKGRGALPEGNNEPIEPPVGKIAGEQ